MQTKKLLSVVIVAFSLLFLTGCGKSPSTNVSTDQDVVGDTTVTTQTDPTSTTSTVTREQCLEVMAYALKGAEYQAKGDYTTFILWAKKTEDLQKKYNMNSDEYDNICTEFLADVNFMDAIQKRMTEL